MNIETVIAGVKFKTPVMNASGTFSRENAEYVDVSKMGAVITKGVSSEPWQGNAPPRVAETYGGMLNSIGLQNPGVEYFINEELPFWKRFGVNVIVNIAGKNINEYIDVAKKLYNTQIEMLELNISCPNVKEGGAAFGACAETTERVTSAVKKVSRQPLIVKLSPNVTDITEIARAAEAGGADALSLINTLLGMQIDIYNRKPMLANVFGGLSGPAIKPVALRMVYQVSRALKIPVIGVGGIMNGEDAAEFFFAGASAVEVGTANLVNPRAVADVTEGLVSFMEKNNYNCVGDLKL